jgi:O-antigen ligase
MHIVLRPKIIGLNIICFCVLFPFILPRGITEYIGLYGGSTASFLTLIYYIGWVVVLFEILCLLMIRQGLSLFTWAAIIYHVYGVAVCLIQDASYDTAMSSLQGVTAFCLLFEIYRTQGLEIPIKMLMRLFYLYLIINVITILMYPLGMYINELGWNLNYFLGYYNLHIFYYIPFMLFFLICSYHKRGRLTWSALLIIFFVFAAIYLVGSATSLVVITAFILLCLFMLKITKINLNRTTIVLGVCMFALISYSIIELKLQEAFKDLIEDVLKRDISFTGRTIIWMTALQYFSESPVIGNGAVEYTALGFSTRQAHNTFLDILVNFGVVGLAAFIILFIMACYRLSKHRKHPYAKILIIGLVAYCIDFLTEMYKDPQFLFMVLFLCYHIDTVISQMSIAPRKGHRIRIHINTLHIPARTIGG